MQKVKKIRCVCIALGSFVVLFMSGCAAVREPVMIDSALLVQQPRTISILPSIDARRDRESTKIKDLDKITHPSLRRALKKRGYKVNILDDYAISHPEGYLAEMSDDEFITLVPKNVEVAFLFVIEDLTSNHNIISHTSQLTSKAYLIDIVKEKIIWKDKYSGQYGGTGIAYGLMPLKTTLIRMSIEEMTRSIPKRGSKPK